MGAIYSAFERLMGRFRSACARMLSVMMADPSTYGYSRFGAVYIVKYSTAPEHEYCYRCGGPLLSCQCRAAREGEAARSPPPYYLR